MSSSSHAMRKDIVRRTVKALEASYLRHPDNDKVLQQLALAYAQTGNFSARAVTVYQRAAEVMPGDIKIQRMLSIAMMISQTGEILRDVNSLSQLDKSGLQRSIEKLSELARTFPESPDIHRALGDLRLLTGDERESLQHYRIAMALGLEDLEPLCLQFEQIRAIAPMSTAVVVFFCELYQRLGRNDRADVIYRRLIEENDGDPLALDAYRMFLERRVEQLSGNEKELGPTICQLCRVTLMQGHESEALTWARQIPESALKGDSALVKDLTRVLIDLSDFRQAFDYLARIPLDPEVKTLLNEISVRLEKAGEIDAAVFLLQYINQQESMEAKREVANFGQEARMQEAAELDIQTELSLAELHWKSRRWRQAFDSYLHVLELGYEDYRGIVEPLDLLLERLPDIEAEPLCFLTNFFAERKDWRRTLSFAERALAVDPTLTNITQRVMQACEQILLQDPNASDVRIRLGDLHLEKNNIERAIQEFRRAAAVPEFSMKANRRHAFSLARAGDLSGALEKYKELKVLDGEDLERLYDLMIAFSVQESFKDAIDTGQLILDYDKKFRDAGDKVKGYEARLAALGNAFAMDPKMRELIGDHAIGRYKYLDKIGSGGMGVVHKVLDLKTSDTVAMKILREGLSSSGKALDRFFREARIASTLRHPNIVRIVDYNISNTAGQSYIAMEFVNGPSIRDIIEKKFSESMDLDMDDVLECLDWMSQLCDALHITHARGIIHRDIKPDNILIGEVNVVKVTDFGIVHIEEATFTPTGALIGTPRYMSPEQVHGGRIDGRSDIYSVGIIMYELLIGSPPFISGDISYQQVNVLPTRPTDINNFVPPSVDRIIMKCLEKSPNDRYQEALELKHDLDETFIRLGGDPERLRSINSVTAETSDAVRKPVNPGVAFSLSRAQTLPLRDSSATSERETPASFFAGLDSELDLGPLMQEPGLGPQYPAPAKPQVAEPNSLDSEFDL